MKTMIMGKIMMPMMNTMKRTTFAHSAVDPLAVLNQENCHACSQYLSR